MIKNKKIQTAIQKIQKNPNRELTNNTQKVGLKLISAGDWVSRAQLDRIPSATARVRDLRKKSFGSFSVECKSSVERKLTEKNTHYYRIKPTKITKAQVSKLFRVDI